jgi:hypothetical protein
MTTVNEVAAAIRHDHPDIAHPTLCRRLYHANAHHLAWFGQPLFAEPIDEWTRDALYGTPAGYGDLTDRQLNTIGYVRSASGDLDAGHLEIVTRVGPLSPELKAFLARSVAHAPNPARPDDLERLRAKYGAGNIRHHPDGSTS